MTDYYRRIVDLLEGRAPEFEGEAPDRVDWGGISAFLEYFRTTTGAASAALIEAMGHIIEAGEEKPETLAEVVMLADVLRLNQLYPQVERLRGREVASAPVLNEAIHNFLVARAPRERPTAASV
ncbi:MAG TPA: hypothetical protein VFW96_14460 [Thermomicrobiales bacterium]|nr:hypothetical protein [Thermomicrobiales bacterium]